MQKAKAKWDASVYFLIIVIIALISFVIKISLTPAFQKEIAGDKTSQPPQSPLTKGELKGVVRSEYLRPPVPKKYRNIRDPIKRNEKNLLAGERLYDIKCSPCHGGNLDGKGYEASGFFPRPANLAALVSIVKPPQAYLFWRIKEGGIGLPKGLLSWNSAMPAWKEKMADEEIWNVILYIYEAVGETPP